MSGSLTRFTCPSCKKREFFVLTRTPDGLRCPSCMGERDAISVREGGWKADAMMGSDLLLLAYFRYGAKHGLPNISADECRRRLGGA